MVNPWQVAFIVLQVIFTLSLSAFVVLIKNSFKDIKALRIKVVEVEKWLAVDRERFRSIDQKLGDIKKSHRDCSTLVA
jgi:hypothetical protein|tara:strand:+ start:1101 stop:1334 length:234 start_codon:yes stop_codon:yes gene_type:complete